MQREIRARIDDPDMVAEKLIEAVGARELAVRDQQDTYYGSITLYEELDRSFLVRVREEGTRSWINYKSEMKPDRWEEHEVSIDTPSEAREVFEGMGLEKVLRVEKVRRSFSYEGMHIHVDSIEELGHFIEVKMDPDAHDRSEVVSMFETAGVGEDQIIEKGYVSELLRRKNSDYAEWCST